MAQLGSDFDSQYPNVIDTRQVYRNGTVVLPDSDTRLDAQALNGSMSAIINIEEALGANIQGAYGSLAARLEALEAGGTGGTPLTNVVAFTDQTVVSLPGAAHQQGQQALHYAVYDASHASQRSWPREHSYVRVNVQCRRHVCRTAEWRVHGRGPHRRTMSRPIQRPGTPPYSATIPGSAHGLGDDVLFVQAYEARIPATASSRGVSVLTVPALM